MRRTPKRVRWLKALNRDRVTDQGVRLAAVKTVGGCCRLFKIASQRSCRLTVQSNADVIAGGVALSTMFVRRSKLAFQGFRSE